MNLDESGVTLDRNQSKSGGHFSTQYGSSNPAIPQGADRTNKSSTGITFIGGNTTVGHPLPSHFQLKSVATDESTRIQTEFLNGLLFVNGVYGSDVIVNN